MVETRPSCRLHVVFADRCRKAVIFRRGPSKSTRLIAWDRASDTFEPGQWIRRASVYAERSHLSPDGAYLLTFIGRFRPPLHAYTVLSRPPYFTALALWPAGDTWGGGGTFIGRREICLNHLDAEAKLAPGFEWPRGFVVHMGGPASRARLEAYRQRYDQWQPGKQADDMQSFVRRGADGVALVATWRRLPRYRTRTDYRVKSPAGAVALPGAQWADLDANGDVLFSCGGALDRLPAGAIAAATRDHEVAAHASRLADFSDMRYEPIVAPYATGSVSEPALAPSPRVDRDAPDDAPDLFAPRLDRVSKEDRRCRRAARKALRESGRL